MKYNLSEISSYITDKILVSELQEYQYISTDNMVLNRGGIVATKCFPNSGKVISFKKGDILISNIRPYFKKIWFARFNGGCSNDVLVVRAKSEIDNKFLYYALSSDEFFDYVTATSKDGTKMPRGDKVAIMKYQLPKFSLETQQKIAKILSALDEKIELNNKINENLHAQAQAIFKSWFVDFEPFKNEKFCESMLGKIPSNFTITLIKDLPVYIADYVANGSFASLKANVTIYNEKEYAYFIRNTDLKSNEFNTYVDEHSYKFLKKSQLIGGEIIISNVGDVGSVFLCPKLDQPMSLGNNVIMLRPEQTNLIYYLFLWFKFFQGKELIMSIIGGSVQAKFNKTDFKNLPIIVPNKEIIQKFHEIVKIMFEKIVNNEIENQKLAQIRDTLLPKLMSGELEV